MAKVMVNQASGILRYTADRRSLAFVAIYFILTTSTWFAYLFLKWYIIIPLVVTISCFSFFGAVITHNTIHAPVFRSRTLNRLFQIVLSFTYGHPVSSFVPGHNFSHHRYTQTNKDVMRSSKARFSWNLLNQALFFNIMSKDIILWEIRFVKTMYKDRPQWFRQYLSELILVIGVKVALAIVDWQRFLLLIFIPHQYAVWGIVGTNFWQHDGTDEAHTYDHSRNFIGRTLNYWAFNNGFHCMHHRRPGLHWSLLPEWHAKYVAPHNHPNLNQRSLVRYLWKICVWPGKRLDYQGRPVVLKPAGNDEDWISELKVNLHKSSLGATQ